MLAESCTAGLRKYDLMARYGGEEFCVVLPYTNADNAALLAEKLRTGIAARTVKVGAGRIRVTASIGLSEVEATDENPGEILERADAALYEAKQSGRNRVCLSRSPQASQHIGH